MFNSRFAVTKPPTNASTQHTTAATRDVAAQRRSAVESTPIDWHKSVTFYGLGWHIILFILISHTYIQIIQGTAVQLC